MKTQRKRNYVIQKMKIPGWFDGYYTIVYNYFKYKINMIYF